MIQQVSWNDFQKGFRWRQSEHLAAIGPSGVGKTTLFRAILPRRKFVIVFGTKKKDKLYGGLIRDGYKRVQSIREIKPYMNRVLLWPEHESTIDATIAKQIRVFEEALDVVARQGGWTCVIDECKYCTEMLGLGRKITFMQEQLRSNDGTNLSGAQRPMWIPRSVLSNATHVFLWYTTDPDDFKRLSDIGGIDRRGIREAMESLDEHEFIYVRTRAGRTSTVRSQVGIGNG